MWCMAMGYIGPKTIPIMDTEMAAAMKEGTSQTINWKLYFFTMMNIRIQSRDEERWRLTTSR